MSDTSDHFVSADHLAASITARTLGVLHTKLGNASTLDEAKRIRDEAERNLRLVEALDSNIQVRNLASEIKLRAQRQIGNELASLSLRGGDRRSACHRNRLTLADLGITADQSKRWQKQARIPLEIFNDYVLTCNELGQEVTLSGLIKHGKSDAKPAQPSQSVHAGYRSIDSGDVCGTDGQSEVSFTLHEILNHLTAINSTLAPLHRTGQINLVTSEARVLHRRLRELIELVNWLNFQVTAQGPNAVN